MRKLLFLMVVLVALWSGYWFVGSNAVREGVNGFFADAATQGLVAEKTALTVQGFPNRFDLQVDGMRLVDPDTTYIDPDVTIGQDTVIWPNTYVQGRTTIGADCVIGPNAILRQAQVGDNCRIEQAVVENAAIPDNTKVQPFTIINGQQLTANS